MENLEEFIAEGYLSRRKHPSEDLFILNYTPRTQYERFWNETTMSCRGLVVDSFGTVRARCFKKFFNYGEVFSEVNRRLSEGLPFRAYEKMDGSLGILYWVRGEPFIATRGSFDSPQAVKANKILRSRPRKGLREDWTYLLEIVYPDNRICVDYGDTEDLFLLSVMDTESGEEILDAKSPFTPADGVLLDSNFSSIAAMDESNREGFVVRFDDSFRFKIKFDQYVKLHSLIHSVSSKSIWNCLKESIELPLDSLPDEIYSWIAAEKTSMEQAHKSITDASKNIFGQIKHLNRKEFAAEALKYECRPVLFAMLDGKPYDEMVWKMVEPSFRTPFGAKTQEET